MKNIIVFSLGDSSWKTIPQIPLGYLYCSCPTKKKSILHNQKTYFPFFLPLLLCAVCLWQQQPRELCWQLWAPSACCSQDWHPLQRCCARMHHCVEKHRAWRNSIEVHEMPFSQLCSSLYYLSVMQIKPSPSHHWFMEICITAFSTQGKNLDFSHFFKQLCKPLNIPSQAGWENLPVRSSTVAMIWSRQLQILDSPGVLPLDTSMGTSGLFSFQKLQMTVATSSADSPSQALGPVVVALPEVLDFYSDNTPETSAVLKQPCQEKCAWLALISMDNWLL